MFDNITVKEIFLEGREIDYGDRQKVEILINKAEKELHETFGNMIINITHHISLPDGIFCVAAVLRNNTDFLAATEKMDNLLAKNPDLTESCVYPYFVFEDFDGDIMYYLKTEIEAAIEDENIDEDSVYCFESDLRTILEDDEE